MVATEIQGPAGTANETLVRRRYEELTRRLIEQRVSITTMESCTSGLIASLITDTEGSSAILKGAFVTYCNEAKVLQGVPASTIAQYGVYSAQTACAMALACKRAYEAAIGVGVTGSFGNVDPNNTDSIPGEVYFAIAAYDDVRAYHCSIPAQPSRWAYKVYMAQVIVDTLVIQNSGGTIDHLLRRPVMGRGSK